MVPAGKGLHAREPGADRRMVLGDVEAIFFRRIVKICRHRDVGDGRPVAEQVGGLLEPFVDDGEIAVDARSVAELEANDSVAELVELQREGKVRFIGMSGVLPNLTDHIAMGVFDAFQIPYSALEREHETSIHDAASAGFRELHVAARTLAELGRSSLKVEGGLLRAECAALFDEWKRLGLGGTY